MVVDILGPHVEGAPENPRECQYVVDLVGEVAASRGDHRRTAGLGLIREDLRGGVGAGENHRVLGHGSYHIPGHGAGGGYPNEHIRALHGIRKAALAHIQIGTLGHLLFKGVHPLDAACVDGSLPVAQGDVLKPIRKQQSGNGNAGRPRPIDDDADRSFGLAHHLQGVDQARQGDDGGAVLVVMKDGDVAFFLELALDLKAAGGCDVLQVYPAKGTGNQVNGVDDLVHILAFDAHGEGVHIPKGLK